MISHCHRTLYVHIPKCGGQSVEQAFLDSLGLDWARRAPLLLRPRVEGEDAPPRLAHLLLKDYVGKKYISQELFDGYFKFSVVRCPYRRVLSFYTYFGLEEKQTLDNFICDELPAFLETSHDNYWFFQPQINYLNDEKGEVGVDKIYCLESLSKLWGEICCLAGMPQQMLPHRNQSKKSNLTIGNLSCQAKTVIRELYSNDFSSFSQYDIHI